MVEKVLLSTDIGSDIDDALALLVILNSDINLRGICTVNGKVEVRSYIAKHMVNLASREIPVARGEEQPLGSLVEPYSFFEDWLVDEAFVKKVDTEVRFKPLEKVGIIPKGVEDLAERLTKEKYAVFSIAPMTNIARLLQEYPEAAKNIEKIYVMGGRFVEEALEHNIRYDTKAAQLVFESEIPLVMVPGELCERYRMPVELIKQIKSPTGAYVKKMARAFMAIKTAEKFLFRAVSTTTGKSKEVNLLTDILKEIKIDGRAAGLEEQKKLFDLRERKEYLIKELSDPYLAAFDTEDYFKKYEELINQLSNPKGGSGFGRVMAKELESFKPKELSVADVYIPYCFLHPEKLKVEKGTVKCTKEGKSYLEKGSKHEIVRDLDFGHFQEFLKKYLK